MPAMTMRYAVDDIESLNRLSVGDTILFFAEKSQGSYRALQLQAAP
jgi:Cu/Ag efflux protein CusF